MRQAAREIENSPIFEIERQSYNLLKKYYYIGDNPDEWKELVTDSKKIAELGGNNEVMKQFALEKTAAIVNLIENLYRQRQQNKKK